MTIYQIQYNKLIQDFKTTNTKNYLKEESWDLRKLTNFSNSLCFIRCREPPPRFSVLCVINFFVSDARAQSSHSKQSPSYTGPLFDRKEVRKQVPHHRLCVCAIKAEIVDEHLASTSPHLHLSKHESHALRGKSENALRQMMFCRWGMMTLMEPASKRRLMYFSTSAQGWSLGRPC